MAIIDPKKCHVRCEATVDLMSKVFRPWLFKVTVTGSPPHIATRVYEIYGKSEDAAAMAGIDKFVKEMSQPLPLLRIV
jgi:hypothetical protein